MLRPSEEILDSELAQPLDLPKTAEELLEILLDDGEEILWEGTPDVKQLMYNSISAARFFTGAFKVIGFCVLGICLIALSWSLVQLISGISLGEIMGVFYAAFIGCVFLFFFGFLISLGIYVLIVIIEGITKLFNEFDINKTEKISYYYTPNQLIFQKGASYQSLPFQHIEKIRYKKEKDENGTIGFVLKKEYEKNAIQTRNLRSKEKRPWPTFELLPNVTAVFKEISVVWESWKTNNHA